MKLAISRFLILSYLLFITSTKKYVHIWVQTKTDPFLFSTEMREKICGILYFFKAIFQSPNINHPEKGLIAFN
jgi:hypothetical protein